MNTVKSNPQSDALFVAIHQLIALGRLTGVTPSLALDGRTLFAAGDDQVEPHANEWREDGTSVAVNEYGGQMIEQIEHLRANLQAQGGVAAEVAKAMPQWYGRRNASITLTPFQKAQIESNRSQAFFMFAWLSNSNVAHDTRVLGPFSEYAPQYVSKVDGSPIWSFEGVDWATVTHSGHTGPVKDIPNMRVVVADMSPAEVVQVAADWAANEITARGVNANGVDFSPVRPTGDRV